MVKRLISRQFKWLFNLVKFLFAGVLFITFTTTSKVEAQTSGDPWATPLNLSRSGIAFDPAIVIDSGGGVHAVWQDNLANFVYTRLDGDQWNAPVMTDLNRLFEMSVAVDSRGQSQLVNYTGPNPLFIAGPGPYIFAFWITVQGELFSSTVANHDFSNIAAWESRRLITPNVASFAVAVDAQGELHLAYVRTIDEPANPAGVYYTRSKNSGRNWNRPILVYESPYFRGLGEGEANLSVTATRLEDSLRVYVVWDNRPRKQVFLSQSLDGGQSWEPPLLVAGPAPDSGLAGPFNIRVGAIQNNVVLIWQSGQLGGACNQMYQSSTDAGGNWSEPQILIEDLLGCTQSNEFVVGLASDSEPPLYFLTETQSQVFLTAWNGQQWSQPQAQSILSGFEEPEIYTEVVYSCHRAHLQNERLYVIGCDQGEGGDVWVTSRELKTDSSLFEPPIWSHLSPVANDNLEMESVELVTTDDGLIHAFFSQYQDPAIYYTYWDGESWSRITAVMKPPESDAVWPATAPALENNLFLVARTNENMLYFSRAISRNALIASSWSTPARIGIDHDGEVGSVDVAWDASSTVYVVYSVPVNEDRGIYLVSSKDQGITWSDPVQVFDGATTGFDLVGAPSLLTLENGILHIIWSEQSIQSDGTSQPLSLYYARSEDGGQTFSDVKLIVEESVIWQEIVADGRGNLHLLWRSQDKPRTVWDQVSLDNGHSWQYPKGLPDVGMLTAVTRDSAGRLHFVGVGSGALGHWLWDGNRWQSEATPSWSVSSQLESPTGLLSTVINKQGEMIVVLSMPTDIDRPTEKVVLYSTRALELPRRQTVTQEVSTQTPSLSTIVPTSPTLELLSTPTNIVDNAQDQTDRSETDDQTSPFIVALIPVALLLLSILVIAIRRATRVRNQ